MTSKSKAGGADQCAEALLAAEERSRSYLRDLARRRVFPSDSALAALSYFHEPFPEMPSHPTELIRMLDEFGSPATVATTGGRYFGFVIGGTLPAALAASRLVNTWNQNLALRVMSPAAAEIEDLVLRWVCEILGIPECCEGGIVTCATTANFTALAAARHALLARAHGMLKRMGCLGLLPSKSS